MDYHAAKQVVETHDSTGPRILVVEDHPSTLKLIQELLSFSFPTCHIAGVGSAEAALETCAISAPHIVIMDIALPGMNGIDAARHIKSMLPATHVVMHSSYDLEVYRQASVEVNASAFIAKSSTCTDLVPAISGLLVNFFDRLQGNAPPVCRDFRTYNASGTGLI